jgi:uncharacterized membrane-anchored protein YitT (DUF2179 family)
MQLEAVRSFIMQKLEKELPPYLSYHNAKHTEDVLLHAEELANSENITTEDRSVLLSAAVMHDVGFLETYADHEEASCRLAEQILPQFDYTQAEIRQICSIIMATRVPQNAKSKLAEILCDADLYYLGTDAYKPVAETLYSELHALGLVKNRQDWIGQQIKFLHGHHYLTPSAKTKLSFVKSQNLRSLQQENLSLKSLTGHPDFHASDLILIIVGVLTAGFSLNGFLVPNKFFDGGITGISLLLSEIYKLPLAVVIVLANLPFVIMGMFTINKRFAFKTLFCIGLLGVTLYWVPYSPITSDNLLVSIFGGFFLGLGIGLTMRAGCAVDGIEVLALYTWRRTSFTISEIILALNIIIFSVAAARHGVPTALYSMITYYTATKTIDYVVEGIEAYMGVTIISGHSELIKSRLVNELGRGITIYKGQRGYLPGRFEVYSDCDIIFTVISRLELRKLNNLVNEIDPNAFVFANVIKEASGGIIKRRHIR